MNLPSRRKSETCYSHLRLWLQNKIHFVTHLYIHIWNWIVGGSKQTVKISQISDRPPFDMFTLYKILPLHNALNVLRHGLMLYVNIYIQYTLQRLLPPSLPPTYQPTAGMTSNSTLIWGFSSYKIVALKQRNGRETDPSEPTPLDLQLTSESTRLGFILYDRLWST